ncbi:HAD family hydrolase [Paenibacillus cremeus]|uniref:HAD family hydrolase n=1 Tax=Paenibacillus cremeus TaxID=2163881 RepID=UPI00164407CC|nr:HAD family hydrolase [Paenibacillus cremeus]
MHGIRVILFDLDDTLIHFDDYWKDSLIETFRRHPATKAIDPKILFDLLWERNKVYEQLYHNQVITLREFRNQRLIDTMALMDCEMGEKTADDFNDLHKETSLHFMKADPELVALLTDLSAVYQLVIVTNGLKTRQHDKIDALGIKALFAKDSILISEEVGHEKPDIEMYNQALSRFSVRPEEALFIGDSWKNDVEGPIRAGLRAIWYNRKNELIPRNGIQPYAMIRTIHELREIL